MRGTVERGPNHPCFPVVVLRGLSELDVEGEDAGVECLDTCPGEVHAELYDSQATGKTKTSMNDEDYADRPDLKGPDSGSESDVRFNLIIGPWPSCLTAFHRTI